MKLTPDERLYRDLWLAECSRPVPEWHQTAGEKERAEARNAAVMGAASFVQAAEIRHNEGGPDGAGNTATRPLTHLADTTGRRARGEHCAPGA